MRRRVVVVGIPGVGKTTVIDGLLKRFREEGIDARSIVLGTVMAQEAKTRYGIANRDRLRQLSLNVQRRLQAFAAKKIASMDSSFLIIDTHLFIRTKEGFWPGLPLNILKQLSPTNLVLVEASPRNVVNRRKRDLTRFRDAASEDEVKLELAVAREMLASAGIITGAPLLIVNSPESRAHEAIEKVFKALVGE